MVWSESILNEHKCTIVREFNQDVIGHTVNVDTHSQRSLVTVSITIIVHVGCVLEIEQVVEKDKKGLSRKLVLMEGCL